MRLISVLFYPLAILVLLLAMPVTTTAHSIKYTIYLDRADHEVGTNLELTDPAYWDNSNWSVIKRNTSISLIYGREDRSDVAGSPWWYRISYKLYNEDYNLPFGNGQLTISHEGIGGDYENLRQYLETAGQVNLYITAVEASDDNFQTVVTDPNAIDALVPDDVRLELQMTVDRYDLLSPLEKPLVIQEYSSPNNNAPDQHDLKLTWNFIPGAESYEVEWWYLDAASSRYNNGNYVPIEKDFKEAVRAEVVGQKYHISITYPPGKVYYRVRPVGRFVLNVSNNDYSRPKYGTWSTVGNIGIDPFETTRNWQYTTTFAEEGKHKKVISYFDDGLKNRQTQTNLSTDEITLVATSHYDVEGRPVVNILPVPALNDNDLFYKAKFNRALDPSNSSIEIAYNRLHFDKSSPTCNPALPDLLSESNGTLSNPDFGGAAHYFSPKHFNNANGLGIHKGYIPDANQYPMTQVRFRNDGTGRIVAQSGVGDFYQLGSGRETKYFYDDVSNFQLRRLFGSNVGDAIYYKRNIVQDANGQLSISYLDAAGRVVATALAGTSPANTLSLDSYTTNAVNITENLLDNNTISADRKLSVSRSQIMNEAEGTVANFQYELEGLIEQLTFFSNTYCLSCKYKLRIRVYDPCYNVVHDYSINEITDPDPDPASDCLNGNATYTAFAPYTFSLTLQKIGIYTVVKELEVLDEELEEYGFMLPPQEPHDLDTLSCLIDCNYCQLKPDTLSGGRAIQPDNPDCGNNYTLIEVCRYVIDSLPIGESCNSIYYQILEQVSPEGCKYMDGPWWQDKISGLSFEINGTTVGGGDPVLQAALQDPEQWQEEWAAILATIHPEYDWYVLCRNTEASREFDLRLSNADTWDEVDPSLPLDSRAIGNGTGAVNVGTLLSLDPMVSTTLGFYPNYTSSNLAIPLSTEMKAFVKLALINLCGSTSIGYCNDADFTPQNIVNVLAYRLIQVYGAYAPTSTPLPLADYVILITNVLFSQQGGSDINGDNVIDDTDKDILRFQLFKGIYLLEKDRLLRELRMDWCGVEVSDCQIVKESDLYDLPFPTGNGSNTQAAGQQEIEDNCTEVSSSRAGQWKEFIEACASGLSPTQIADIESNLLSYCNEVCGPYNPLVYFIEETPINNSMTNVESILTASGNASCWNDFTDVHMMPYSEVYELLVVNGTNVSIPISQEEDVNLDAYFNWCLQQLHLEGLYENHQLWQSEVDLEWTAFLQQRNCLDGINEKFWVTYKSREHHYTLYYYDQAGNLVQTVPPDGVEPLAAAAFDAEGNWNGTTEPNHTQVTQYQYNTLGQVVKQYSPDGGTTQFKYDYAQRLRVSQNEKQASDDILNPNLPEDYSFTSYDAQGRIVKVGELKNADIKFGILGATQLNDFDFPANGIDGNFTDVVYTDYNEGIPDLNFAQQNLRGRVSKTSNEYLTTRYSYDAHGNVTELQHQVSELNEGYRVKVAYDYDLISGNVKEVAYQRGKNDQFFHRYSYDADNRLTRVFSSDDGLLWEKDARYFYYAHGPLARIELGQDKVQGLDYYYTLQGWIKGVNLPDLPEKEPGADGLINNNNWHRYIPQDAMAYTLGYHQYDYRPIDAGQNQGSINPVVWNEFNNFVLSKDGVKGLFNGNISWMMTEIPSFNGLVGPAMNVMAYKYDQLHRIKNAISFEATPLANSDPVVFNLAKNDHHSSEYSYDPNGNLTTLVRQALDVNGAPNAIDVLTYRYGNNGVIDNNSNKLLAVSDYSNSSFNVDESIKDQTNGGISFSNYSYDEIGNLTADAQEDINTIQWNVFGKVKAIFFEDESQIQFTYDPSGNRLSKTKITNAGYQTATYYLRDASGNVLSVYEKETSGDTFNIAQKEVPLYGSSRLGLQKFFDDRPLGGNIKLSRLRQRGEKYYELNNHLGNVLAVVSDQKTYVDTDNNGTADSYAAYIVSANDYRPFGEVLRGRSFDSPDYRYGFNGKEKDQSGEWGSLTHYDYGFRIYNPGVARFLSVDPLSPDYPWYTPYQFAGNKPIVAVDLDGAEEYHFMLSFSDNGDPQLEVLSKNDITDRSTLYTLSLGRFGTKEVNTREQYVIHTGEYSEYFLDNAYGAGFHKEEITIRYSSEDELIADAPNFKERVSARRSLLEKSALIAGAAGAVASEQQHFGTGADIGKNKVKTPQIPVREITISKTKYPESAKHIQDAQAAGHPKVLTIDREGGKANRRESLRGVKTEPGKDRDEYPPAMFKEGGKGASVRCIDCSDNRGSGSSMGHQLRDLPNGSKVIIKVEENK